MDNHRLKATILNSVTDAALGGEVHVLVVDHNADPMTEAAAQIFSMADYGLKADLVAAVPVLVELLP